jgi:hypothetical protein
VVEETVSGVRCDDAKLNYNLNLGDSAIIEDGFFQTAIRLSNACVEQLTKWSGE